MGKALTASPSESAKTARPLPTDKVRQFPHQRRVTNEDELMEAAQIHGAAQHPYVFLGVGRIQGSHCLIPEQGFVSNALTLPHAVDGNA